MLGRLYPVNGLQFSLNGSLTPSDTSALLSIDAFTVYAAVYPDGTPQPTAAQIESGIGAISADSGPNTSGLTFTGLSQGTPYTVYLVGKNASGRYTAITTLSLVTSGGSILPILVGAGII